MRKILLIIFFVLSLSPLNALDFAIDDGSLLLRERNFSFDLSSGNLFYRGRYFSYGRLDSFSSYSTLFNPYRKYHNTGLSVTSGTSRGVRGFLFGVSSFSFAFSSSDALTAALNYEGKYFDLSLIYYNSMMEDEKNFIHNYRRKEKKDIYSIVLHTGYKSYVDFLTVLSYSPLLGVDGFYRISGMFEPLFLTLKYGNTLLSDNDGLFSIEGGITTRNIDFDYHIRYDESSYYTDFFRSYASSYDVRLKWGKFSFLHTSSFSFSRSAEIDHVERIGIGYDGVRLSYDSKGRMFMEIRRVPFELGIDSSGAFIRLKIGRSIELKLDGEALGLDIGISF